MTYYVIAPVYSVFRAWVAEQGLPMDSCKFVHTLEDLKQIIPSADSRMIKLANWAAGKPPEFLDKVKELESLPTAVKASCGSGVTALPAKHFNQLKIGFLKHGFTELQNPPHIQVKPCEKNTVPPGSYKLRMQHKNERVVVLERKDNNTVVVISNAVLESLMNSGIADISAQPI